jgi:hypothetical protein
MTPTADDLRRLKRALWRRLHSLPNARWPAANSPQIKARTIYPSDITRALTYGARDWLRRRGAYVFLEYHAVGVDRPLGSQYLWQEKAYPDLRYGGYLDVVGRWESPRSWLAIEIDRTNNPRSLRKLELARDAGFAALWIRWGVGDIAPPPRGIDLVAIPIRDGLPTTAASHSTPPLPMPRLTMANVRSIAWRLSPAQDCLLREIARGDRISLSDKRRPIVALETAGLVRIRTNHDFIARISLTKLGAAVCAWLAI